MSLVVGKKIEKMAVDYLKNQGLTMVCTNFHCRFGEIDIIMWQKEVLVFVEVRQRTSHAFGGALSSVDFFKQQKLIKAANYYMVHKQLTEKHPARFDILSVEGDNNKFNWLKNAIELDNNRGTFI